MLKINSIQHTLFEHREQTLVPGTLAIPLQSATKYSIIKFGYKWLNQCRKQKILKIHMLPPNCHNHSSYDGSNQLWGFAGNFHH